MNDTWTNFLNAEGAHRSHDIITSYNASTDELSAAQSETVICDLSHSAIIAVNGADATTFLQNQLTNDIAQVLSEMSQISGYCTPKGRLLCIFRVFIFNQTLHLKCPRPLVDSILGRLKKYIMMSKVEFEDLSSTWAHLGIAGTQSFALLQKLLGGCPEQKNAAFASNDCVTIRIADSLYRYEIAGDTNKLIELWNALKNQSTPIGYNAWNWLDIQAGIPQVFPQTTEAFIPQTVNFESIGGLSFTKGCYPGQEIVARMNYLGSLKRRMYLLHGESVEIPEPGQSIFCDAAGNEEIVGKIVNASLSPNNGIDVLAVIQIKYAEKASFHFGRHDGPKLTLQQLPYPLPDLQKTK